MIQTVNGNVSGLGITMSHEHLIIDLRQVRKDEDSFLTDENMVIGELLKAKELGVDTIIELTCNDMGRDVIKLKEISTKTGLNIICSTGFYLKEYHTDFVRNARTEELEELFLREISEGIGPAGIRAGIIGEIGCSRSEIDRSEEKVLIASGRASRRTNTAVSTHCDMGRLGREQLDLLLATGMDSDKIILGHTDLTGSVPYQLTLLEAGANIAFDTIGKTAYLSDERRAECICDLLDKGYGDKLLLSQDVSRRTYLKENGGAGYCMVLEHFIPLLINKGVSDSEIKKMLVDNPERILEMG